jgi:hypothetical protein
VYRVNNDESKADKDLEWDNEENQDVPDEASPLTKLHQNEKRRTNPICNIQYPINILKRMQQLEKVKA